MNAISRRDFDAIRKIYHPDYSYTGANGERQEGPEAGLAVARTYTTAFPDLTFDIRHTHAVGAHTVAFGMRRLTQSPDVDTMTTWLVRWSARAN